MKSVAGHVGVVCVALLGFTEAQAQDVRQAVEALESENEIQDADLFDLFGRTSSHESRLEAARVERETARQERQQQAADLAELRAEGGGSAAQRIRELANQVSDVGASGSVLGATAVVLEYAVAGLVTLGGEVEALDAALRVTKGDAAFAKGEFTAAYRVLSENDASQADAIDALDLDLMTLGGTLDGAITVIDNALIELDERTTALEEGPPNKNITLETKTGDIFFLTVGETTAGLASSEAVASLQERVTALEHVPAPVAPQAALISTMVTKDLKWQVVEVLPSRKGATSTGLLGGVGFGYEWTDADIKAAIEEAGLLLNESGVSCWAADDLGSPSTQAVIDGIPVQICVVSSEPPDSFLRKPGMVLYDPGDFIVAASQIGGMYDTTNAVTPRGSLIP